MARNIRLQTNSGTYYSLVMENDCVFYSFIMMSDKLRRLLLISGLDYEENVYDDENVDSEFIFTDVHKVKMYNIKELQRFIEIMKICRDEMLYINDMDMENVVRFFNNE